MDGAIYEWEVTTSKRLHEAVLKACGYTGLGISADAKTVYAVGTDRKIKEIFEAQVRLRRSGARRCARSFVANRARGADHA